MKFMIFLYHDAKWFSSKPEVFKKTADEYETFTQAARKSGAFIDGFPLKGEHRTVRIPHDRVAVSDGPNHQGPEAVVGYYILDYPSLDVAAKEAANLPAARLGSVEIREFMET